MNYKLNVQNGKVKYMYRHNGEIVGSDTPSNTAYWMLLQNRPHKSDEFPGYPIATKLSNGDEYFLKGEWLMGGDVDVLAEDKARKASSVADIFNAQNSADNLKDMQNGQSAACGPDYCEPEPPKPARKRRAKDIVCE